MNEFSSIQNLAFIVGNLIGCLKDETVKDYLYNNGLSQKDIDNLKEALFKIGGTFYLNKQG